MASAVFSPGACIGASQGSCALLPWGCRTQRCSKPQRALANKEADALLQLIAPAHPLEAILALQAVLLSSDPNDVLEAIALERDRVHGLPDRLRLLYQALSAVGPTHAGDARLLERTGTSRTRATHGLKELEGLVWTRLSRVMISRV